MKRSKHSLSHYVLSTFDMGQLIPVANYEVLPGDSIRMSTSALIRLTPLMAPVMHPVQVRIHHWYVPYRVLWDEWEDFITGGSDGLGDGAVLPIGPADSTIGSLGNYLGLPDSRPTALEVVAFPFIAYNRIFNEFYRDQDLQTEIPDNNNTIQRCAWEKDRFTAARPWTQKGPEVTLPIAGSAPVVGNPLDLTPRFQYVGQASPGNHTLVAAATSGALSAQSPGPTGTSANMAWLTPNLEANLNAATSSTVNDVRLAFALQRYQEARAQYGSRYTEYLRYLGVRSSDARLQRPEYLGGGRTTIQFSEVLRTGNDVAIDPEAPIGEMRGHGISAVRSRRWTRFFEEHGVVLSLASVRPRTMYTDGMDRSWFRRVKEDYWQKELERIGQQEVYNAEVYAPHATPTGTFGYDDRYSEYRHQRSRVSGEFETIMNDWHLARTFSADPVLNSAFIQCDPSKRIFAEQTQHSLWGMFSHSIQARRMVGKRTIGRIF